MALAASAHCESPGGQAPAASPTSKPAAQASSRPLPLAAEFDRQSAILLGSGELVLFHPKVYVDLVTALRPTVTVLALVADDDQRQAAAELLAKARLPTDAARLLVAPVDTMWVRDYGPFFVRRADGSAAVLDLDYTPVTRMQPVRRRDDRFPRAVAESLGLPAIDVPLRLGGGNLLTNGAGLCVSTKAALRNNLDRSCDAGRIGCLLGRHFGATTWVYVEELEGEPTRDADMFMTFLSGDAVVVAQADPAGDPNNAAILDDTAALLARQRGPGGPMKVHRVPMPPQRHGVWRTYTNIILANGTLVMPSFSDVPAAVQDKAVRTYAALLPEWRIVPVAADSLATSEGLFHCISRNIPAFVSVADMKPFAKPRTIYFAERPGRGFLGGEPALSGLDYRLGRIGIAPAPWPAR
jgi:agmatine/peptidylarginine deiminase